MLSVVCFKWFDPNNRYNDRFLYTAEHVNRLKRMVSRHLRQPHEFICVTDDPSGLDSEIKVRPLDPTILQRAGNRYPKLSIFRPDASDWLGRRILMLDLDTVVVGALDPLVARAEDFCAWRDPRAGRHAQAGRYNSSMVLLTAGAFPQVWHRFIQNLPDTDKEPDLVSRSDQDVIWRVLGDDHPVWTPKDGVLSFKADLIRKRLFSRERDPSLPTRLPWGARVVFFHGGVDFTSPEFLAKHKWVARNWR